MLEINVPGHGILDLSHLILDYNGTIACDGHLLQGVKERGAADAILAADIVVGNILDVLDLLRHPLRLTATLRS